ncbi:LamG-like jellyroll fold domain-containing protein [Paraflavisolibacter sp. H34]|uniref:LamG-like jellyroll fold domain-containing protein n=1 Tax=Huijunlia imazamoxiresistens TaxID=3127457 RepID=UPI003017AEAC
MKRTRLLFALGLLGCLCVAKTYAQIGYPYFPETNVKADLSGVAAPVATPSTLVVNQSKDFTLEVNGTAGVPVRIANGFTSYDYTPGKTARVRFVKKASVVYVYEDAVYKTIISPTLLLQFPAIRSESDHAANKTGIYNAANLVANPGFETRVVQGTSTTHFKDGVYWNAYNESKALDWSTGTTAAIRSSAGFYSEGSYALIMHGTTRYLTQNLGKLKPGAYYQISYDYWTSAPASNGGATYNILLGTEQFGSNVTTLTGHTTSLTDVTKQTFSGVFQAPATLADVPVWLTLHRPISKVDWIDRVSLVQTVSASTPAGITGAGGDVLYVEGTAYAPKIHLDAAAGDYVEMTPLVVNPSFETSTTGWTNNGMVTQTNTSFGAFKNGTTYVEKWVSAAPLPNVSITQTLSGLPNGKYTLTAAAHHLLQNPLSGKPGAFLFANDAQTEVGDRKDYSVDFLVADRTAVLGFKTLNAQGNWAALDHFRLRYKGFSADAMIASLQAVKDSATALLDKKMQHTVRTGLQDAIDAAQGVIANAAPEEEELTAVLLQLQNAVKEGGISVAAYSGLQTAVDSAIAVYGSGTGTAADTLQAVIEKNQTLAGNFNATLEELKNGVTEVYAALFAFRVVNATGAAPIVTTNPEFARGATMAFGRSTITGMAATDVLEHGFCWSTHPQPTINDHKTTKYFSNNGYIYRLENLQPSTVYYMRAYALSKSYAVGYGAVVKVITIPKGTMTYTFASSVTNSGDAELTARIKSAIGSAVDVYFNNLTSIKGHRLDVRYNAGTPTAEASYGGYLQFGPNASYQRTGTALHEIGHTIGVGQHSMWYGPNSPLRQTGSSGAWLGERANKVVQFIDNSPAGYMRGDGTHMWPYGVNGAQEDNGSELLYTANALIVQGLGEDGLPPTGGFATPAYTFSQEDTVKYYIKTEDVQLGRDVAFLSENASGQLASKVITAAAALANDSAAWYFRFDPATGYYQIRNAATGNYFSYQSAGENGITLTAVTQPAASQSFQLMAARAATRLGKNGDTLAARAYWIVRPEARLNPPTLAATASGATSAVTFNFNDDAAAQRWLLLSGAEVEAFKQVEGSNQPVVTNPYSASGDGQVALTWDFQFDTRYDIQRSESAGGTFQTIATGFSGVRYADEALVNGKTYYYKVVAQNTAGSSPETPVLQGTPAAGRHLYIPFDEASGSMARDEWGGYHATLNTTAARAAGTAGGALRLDGTATASATLATGALSTLTDFTITTWVKLDALSNWMRIFDFGTGTSKYMFLSPQVSVATGKSTVRYAIKNGGSELSVSYADSLSLNTWTHFAVSQSGDTARLYINGKLVAANNAVTIRPADLGSTNLNYIGKSQFADPMLKASVDEFKIYNRALTVSELADAMKQEQTISFPEFTQKRVGDAGFSAGATASSGLEVTYTSSNESVATVVSGLVQLKGTGTATITASQAGNATYAPASKEQVLTVLPFHLQVQHKDGDGGQTANNNLRPYLKIVSLDTVPVLFSELTARYWFTTENASPVIANIDWAKMGTAHVKARYVALGTPLPGTTGYVEYSFDTTAGLLKAGGNSGEIFSKVYHSNWVKINELNDYSYAAHTFYTAHPQVTLYRNGQLVWGVEPTEGGVPTAARLGAAEEAAAFSLTVAPNPSATQFTLVIGSAGTLQVFDMTGKLVEAHRIAAPNTTLQLGSSYRPGTYLVEVARGSERRVVKLVKQ